MYKYKLDVISRDVILKLVTADGNSYVSEYNILYIIQIERSLFRLRNSYLYICRDRVREPI